MTGTEVAAKRRIRQRPPTALIIPAVIGGSLFVLPLAGLAARTPWSELPELITDPVVVDALQLSLLTSLAATVLALVAGVPLAWVLARVGVPRPERCCAPSSPCRWCSLLWWAAPRSCSHLGRRGLVGETAQRRHRLPPAVLGVGRDRRQRLRGDAVPRDHRGGGAAPASICAGPSRRRRRWGRQTTDRVPSRDAADDRAVPPSREPCWPGPGHWASSAATVTFAGNLQGRTQTLPLAVFVALESDRDAAVAISLVLVTVSLVVLVSLRHHWWRRP